MPLGAARFGLLGGVADLGKLELIQTQTASGGTTVEFTSIQESTYNVHFITINNLQSGSNMYSEIRLSNDGGSTFETTNYQRAVQYGSINGIFGENRTTSADRFSIMAFATAGTPVNNYAYLYNLGNSSKYSFVTHHSTVGNEWMYFGSGVYAVAETINAIQVLNSAGASFTDGTISLYGIAES